MISRMACTQARLGENILSCAAQSVILLDMEKPKDKAGVAAYQSVKFAC